MKWEWASWAAAFVVGSAAAGVVVVVLQKTGKIEVRKVWSIPQIWDWLCAELETCGNLRTKESD